LTGLIRRILVLAFVSVVLAAPLAACGGGRGSRSTCSSAKAEPINPDLHHVLAGGSEPVYSTDPPTSGAHAPGSVPKGTLDHALSRPSQVGALEAGVVLLQYRDLSADEMRALRDLVTDNVVVAPNPSLPDRVVATAWLFKQTCSGVDTAALRGFIRTRVGHGPGADG
jgi:hypothetical protein